MRNQWNHTTPDNVQPVPEDNASEDVLDQVNHWVSTGQLINPEVAMEIASWWQTPKNAFAPFASMGTITDELAPEIEAVIAEYINPPDPLRALLAYVITAQVTMTNTWHSELAKAREFAKEWNLRNAAGNLSAGYMIDNGERIDQLVKAFQELDRRSR